MLPRNCSRSIARQAIHSDSKVPSCGNQPAHIRLTTRRHDTLDTPAALIRSTKRRPQRRLRPPLHPAHLTKCDPYQNGGGSSSFAGGPRPDRAVVPRLCASAGCVGVRSRCGGPGCGRGYADALGIISGAVERIAAWVADRVERAGRRTQRRETATALPGVVM